MAKIKKEGVLLVISSPSGTGKTTICKKLLEYDKNIHLSVSVTTRKKRKNEVEGIDYWVEIPNGNPVACNPISAPIDCTSERIESL